MFCNNDIEKQDDKKPLRITLKPKNDLGKENLYLSVYEDNITVNYDYYEASKKPKGQKAEEFFDYIIELVTKIVQEQLIVVTTYNKLHTFPVANIMSPDKSKRIARKKNFRARSFQGTYDDDYPYEKQ
jgi:hypothetical protein